MKALYRNPLYSLIETVGGRAVLVNDESEWVVSLGARNIVVDPTDEEIAAAKNLPKGYAVDGEQATDLRALLRGEIPRAGPDAGAPGDV